MTDSTHGSDDSAEPRPDTTPDDDSTPVEPTGGPELAGVDHPPLVERSRDFEPAGAEDPSLVERSRDLEPAVPVDPVTDELPAQPADQAGARTDPLAVPVVDSGGAAEKPTTKPVTQAFGGEAYSAVEVEPVPPAGESPVVTSSPKARRTWRTVGLVTAAVLLLAVIGGVGTELYLRNKVTGCLEGAFSDLTGTSTTVSVPRGPLLLAWMQGNVDWVQVDTDDSGSGTEMRLHARATDVSRDGRTVQRLQGEAYVPYERVVELTKADTGGEITVDSIKGDGDTGTITIDSRYRLAFLAIPATVVLKPVLNGGRVDFEVQDAKAFGIGLPNDFAQELVDQVATAMLGPLFDEIEVEDLKATDKGIEFHFAGDDVNMQAASAGTTSTSGASACT